MSEIKNRIQSELAKDLTDPAQVGYIGSLGDMAVANGMRFGQDFNGSFKAAELTAEEIVRPLPPYNPDFVTSHQRTNPENEPYVGLNKLYFGQERTRDAVTETGLSLLGFVKIRECLPDEYIVQTSSGDRLGMKVANLHAVRSVLNYPMYKLSTLGHERKAFSRLCKLVLTAPQK